MYIKGIIQVCLVYITLTTGQSTVPEGDNTCDGYINIIDRIADLEKMIKDRMDNLDGDMKQVKEEIIAKDDVTMLRRLDGITSFELPWAAYKAGFGDLGYTGGQGELWLGLDTLHKITSEKKYGVNVTMTTWDGKSFWAYYSQLSVGPESDNYRLSVSGFDVSSTAPDKLGYHNNMEFSTNDRDNDLAAHDCSANYKGGWWYNECAKCHPTGLYLTGGVDNSQGITWNHVPGYSDYYSFKRMTFTLNRNKW